MKTKDFTNLALCAAAIVILFAVFGSKKPTPTQPAMMGYKRKRLNDVV